MSSVLVLIPARLAATRLPGKPLAEIQGKTMIEHVYNRACEADVGPVYVACCGEEIGRVIENAGGKVVYTNPDLPSGTDRIYQAAKELEGDIIINLQGDLPFVSPDILRCVLTPLENPAVDMATVAAPITNIDDIQNPNVVKIAMSFYAPHLARASYFSRSPIPYGASTFYHHIGIYAFKRAALERFVHLPPSYLEKTEKLEQLRALEAGFRIDVACVEHVPQSVDTFEDLEKLR